MLLNGKTIGIVVGGGYTGLLPGIDQGAMRLMAQKETYDADTGSV